MIGWMKMKTSVSKNVCVCVCKIKWVGEKLQDLSKTVLDIKYHNLNLKKLIISK